MNKRQKKKRVKKLLKVVLDKLSDWEPTPVQVSHLLILGDNNKEVSNGDN